MYCRKCGKFIEYEGDMCRECLAKQDPYEEIVVVPTSVQQITTTQPQSVSQPVVNAPRRVCTNVDANTNRKLGFGKALASAIMSTIGSFIISLAESLVGNAASFLDGTVAVTNLEQAVESNIASSIFMTIIALGLAIPALIMGIQSIITFARAKRGGGVAPVATLVLGIISVVFAASILLNGFIVFCELIVVYEGYLAIL